MNVLVVGNGGREHALAWKLSQSPEVSKVYVAPGNAGTAVDAENVDISQDDYPALIQFAKEHKIGLTVVGPEAPLVGGLVDAFLAEGLRVFGPTKKAAQMEGSKIFCKEVLNRALVPTARSQAFDNPNDAYAYLRATDQDGYVVKAGGLAAGKGVVVCDTKEEAAEAVPQPADETPAPTDSEFEPQDELSQDIEPQDESSPAKPTVEEDDFFIDDTPDEFDDEDEDDEDEEEDIDEEEEEDEDDE